MAELVAPVAQFGTGLQRVTDKQEGPYQDTVVLANSFTHN